MSKFYFIQNTEFGDAANGLYVIKDGGAPVWVPAAQAHASGDLLQACKLALDYLQTAKFSDGDAYPALIKAIAKAEGQIK